MATEEIVLRQHLLGGGHRSYPLQLSLDGKSLPHGICRQNEADQDVHLNLTDGSRATECAAIIRPSRRCPLWISAKIDIGTQHGSVCLEALSSPVFVQSYGSWFSGASKNGWMPLKLSRPPECRVMVQLHPGETFYVGKITLSIVSKEHENIPLMSSPFTSSRYNSYVEQISQRQTNSHIKLEPLDTPLMSENGRPTTPDGREIMNPFGEHGAIMDTIDRRMTAELHHDSEAADVEEKSETTDGSGQGPTSPRERIPNKLQASRVTGAIAPGETMVNIGNATHTTKDDPVNPLSYGSSEPESHIAQLDTQGDTQDSLLGSIHVNKSAPIAEPNHGTEPLADVTKLNHSTAIETARAGECETLTPRSATSSKKRKRVSASPALPTSSIRSTRSSVGVGNADGPISGNGATKVVFATSSVVGTSPKFTKFLKREKIEIVESINECTVLCIGRGELKRTCKIIMATLLGKEIITDDWVTNSVKAKKLLDISSYKAKDSAKEAEWGTCIADAIERGRRQTKCLDGWTVVFTQAAKKDVGKSGFEELKELVTMAGAKAVNGVLPKKLPTETPETLVIATLDDPSVAKLETGWKCFTRDIIGISILRGVLNIDSDEFLVQVPVETEERGRKSKRQKR